MAQHPTAQHGEELRIDATPTKELFIGHCQRKVRKV